MAFDIEDVLGGMKDAMKGELDDDNGWEEIKDYWEQVLEDRKEALRTIGDLRLQGALTDDEMEYELKQEKETLEIQFLALKQMTKSVLQRMINAAMAALRKAILDLV
jgi:chaperonin cofactor prefoldin